MSELSSDERTELAELEAAYAFDPSSAGDLHRLATLRNRAIGASVWWVGSDARTLVSIADEREAETATAALQDAMDQAMIRSSYVALIEHTDPGVVLSLVTSRFAGLVDPRVDELLRERAAGAVLMAAWDRFMWETRNGHDADSGPWIRLRMAATACTTDRAGTADLRGCVVDDELLGWVVEASSETEYLSRLEYANAEVRLAAGRGYVNALDAITVAQGRNARSRTPGAWCPEWSGIAVFRVILRSTEGEA